MSESGKDFPDWETLYKSQKIETTSWYNENFDSHGTAISAEAADMVLLVDADLRKRMFGIR
jgi:hypothetical protein